jgi:ADP-ribosylglycohydrolase
MVHKPYRQKVCLLGAAAGDIIGARFEGRPHKSESFQLFTPSSRFTDDSVLTVAVADAILHGRDYGSMILEYARRYPRAGYGSTFREWIRSSNPRPYNSFGNGSAMRVSPVGWAFDTDQDVLREAERTALPTHNHPEGIKGAQAIALAVFLARKGNGKDEIREQVAGRFRYDLSQSLEAIRPGYSFDVTCQGSVPPAMLAFLEAGSVEDAIRKAISLGGDADTLAAIAGSVAEAYYGGLPDELLGEVRSRLPLEFWRVIEDFSKKYCK